MILTFSLTHIPFISSVCEKTEEIGHFFHSRLEIVQSLFFQAVSRLNSGVQREILYAKKHFSKSSRFKTLHALFQKVNKNDLEIKEEELPGVKLLREEIQELESHPLLNKDADFSSDQLKSLSRLKKEENEISLEVNSDQLRLFYGNGRLNYSDIPSLTAFFDKFFSSIEEKSPFSDNVQAAYKEAVSERELFEQFLQAGAGNHQLLRQKAEDFHSTITSLQHGKPFIYFGELPGEVLSKNSFFDSFLKNALPKEIYGFLDGNHKNLVEKVKTYLLENLSQNEEIQGNVQQIGKEIEESLKKVLDVGSNALQKALPSSWYEKIAAALKEDLRELAVGVRSKEGNHSFSEKIWDRMVESGLQKALEQTLEESMTNLLSQGEGVLNGLFDQTFGQITDKLPKELLQCMSAAGLRIGGKDKFWIELRKQENELYGLYFISNEDEMVFRDIAPERLTIDFFFRLLSYEAWPASGMAVNYSLDDIRNGLLKSLQNDPVEQASLTIKNNPLEWLKIYTHHYSGVEKEDFEKFILFDLPYQMLVNFWPKVHQNPQLLENAVLREQLHKILDQLSDEGVKLFKENALTSDELKKLYATVWEAQTFMEKAEKKTPPSFRHSTVVPKELQGPLKDLLALTGLSSQRIDFLKQAIAASLGEEIGESLDLIIEEIVPVLLKEEQAVSSQEKTWSEVFGIDAFKKFAAELKTMRLSPLHIYRLIAKVFSVLSCLFGFSLLSNLLESLVKCLFPSLNIPGPFSIRHLVQLICLFGTPVLKKIIPPDTYRILDAVVGIFFECAGYLLERLQIMVLAFFIRWIINPEQMAFVKESLKILQQKMIRVGELSYELGSSGAPEVGKGEKVQNSPEISGAGVKLSNMEEGFFLDFPRPARCVLTASNVREKLVEWQKAFETINEKCSRRCFLEMFGNFPFRWKMSRVYLNEQLRNLPVPGQKGGEIWQEVDNPEEILELLHPLFFSVREGSFEHSNCLYTRTEQVASIFTLYAIVDALARRCEESRLSEKFLPNGTMLAKWLGNPLLRVANPRTFHKLIELAGYFGLEPLKHYPDYYAEEPWQRYANRELEQYEATRLFYYNFIETSKFVRNEEGKSCLENGFQDDPVLIKKVSGMCGANTPDDAYFLELLKDKKIQKKLSLLGIKESDSLIDKLAILFKDPRLGINQGFEKTDAHPLNDRRGLLPRPFYLLRFVDLISREISVNLAKDNDGFTIKNRAEGFQIWAGDDDLFDKHYISGRMLNSITKFSEKLSGGLFKIKSYKSNMSLNPKMKEFSWDKVFLHRVSYNHEYDPPTSLGVLNNNEIQGKWITRLNRRSQSEIMVKGPLQLAKTAFEEQCLLEMINSHESDQLVRCLSYFTEFRHRLAESSYRSLFEIFTYQLSALDAQLKERPAIVKDVGKFFIDTCGYFERIEDYDTCLFLAKAVLELLPHYERHHDEASRYFPDFRGLLERVRLFALEKKNKYFLIYSEFYLVSSYRFLDISKATEKEKQEALAVIARLNSSGLLKECKTLYSHRFSLSQAYCEAMDAFYKWGPEIENSIKKGCDHAPIVLSDFPDNSREQILPKGEEERVVSRENAEGLSLLEWFQPRSSIELRAKGEKLKRILFKNVELFFEIKEIKGNKEAVSVDGKTPGFYISRSQHHEALLPYSDYLLLENEKGEKKAHLILRDYKKLLAAFFIKQADISISPFIEKCLSSLFESHENSLLTYDLDSSGRLDSGNPEALAYLVFFHFAKGDYAESIRYFSKLEDYGKRNPFSEKLFAMMDQLTIPLLISQQPEAVKLLLSLEAVREENALIYEQDGTCSQQTLILRWAAMQIKYLSYINETNKGLPGYLSRYQELFILKSITRIGSGIIKKQYDKVVSSDSLFGSCLKKIGIDEFAGNQFIIPAISLRRRLLNNQEAPLQKDEAAEPSKDFFSSNLSGEIPKIAAAYRNFSKKMRAVTVDFIEIVKGFEPCKEVSVDSSDLTPDSIKKHFLYFYRLASGKFPPEMKKTPETQKPFKEQCELFRRNLTLLAGSYADDTVRVLISILETGAGKVEPEQLEKACLQNKFSDAGNLLNNLWDMCRISQMKGSLLNSGPQLASLGINAIKFLANKKLNKLNGLCTYVKGKKVLNHSIGPVNKKRSSLSAALIKALIKREREIDSFMKKLLDVYFIEEKIEHKANSQKKVEPYESKELNQSLKDYYSRAQPEIKQFSLKPETKIEALKKELTQLRVKVSRRLDKEKAYIETFANHPFEKPEIEEVISRLGKEKKELLAFEEIVNVLLQEKDEELMKRTGMNRKQFSHLKERIYLYLVLYSRWNLLFEQAEKLAENNVGAIASELERRRVYEFSGIPERLLRGKLIFESRTGKMLWKEQSSQMDLMLLSKDYRQVVELIMGSGKSWYGIPIGDYYTADGKETVINIWPSSVAKTNIEMIGKQGRQIFNQTANAIEFNRKRRLNKDKMWALLNIFKRTGDQREQMNSTKESLQAMELCYIEHALDVEGKFAKDNDLEEQEEAMEHFLKTLAHIRFDSRTNIDEFHKAADPKKELNYPIGKRCTVEKKLVSILSETIYQLVAAPEFLQLLTVKSKMPSPFSQEDFKAKILPELAKKIAGIKELEIKKTDREAFIEYITGNAKSVPGFVSKSGKCSEIALVKGLLTVLIPASLEKTIHVDFNPSKKGNGEYARPSEGNDNPLEDSTIRSPYEALVKSALMLIHDRLNPEQLDRFIQYLKKRANLRAQKGGMDREMTLEAQFFKINCKGYELFTFKAADRKNVHQLLNESDRVILAYFKHFVADQIYYYALNLTSTSANFCSMSAAFYSDTGTPYNKGCYPDGTKILNHPGTDGESIDILEKEGTASVHVLEAEAPWEVLDELINNFFKKDPFQRALIERGASLNGCPNDKVAKRLLDYITESRPDLDGVVFYMNSEQVIWEKGASAPIPMSQSKISAERRLSYFPQPQTFAADIPQIPLAVGVITIGEDINEHDLIQGMWRMRGLKKLNQKLVFVMTERVKNKIAGGKTPTIRDIIAFAKQNEDKQALMDNYQADRQKMHDVVRRAVLDKAYCAPNYAASKKIIRAFKDLFLSKMEIDPVLLFGSIDKMESPKKIFDLLRKKYYQMVESSRYFTTEEKEKIFDDLQKIGTGIYPKEVHAYQNDLNKSSAIEADEETDNKKETDDDLQVELDVNQVNTKEKTQGRVQSFYHWPKNLNPTCLESWLKIGIKQPVPIFSLKKVVADMEAQGSSSVSRKLSPLILASNNIIHLIPKRGSPVEPFGKYQIPLLKALIIKKEGKSPIILLVDQEEAENFWRKKLAEDRQGKYERDASVKLALYDIATGMLVAEGFNPFTDELNTHVKKELNTDGFKSAVIQIKFLRGDVQYNKEEYEILKKWLEADLDGMMAFFHRVHKLHGKNPYEGSILEKIVLELKNETNDYVI